MNAAVVIPLDPATSRGEGYRGRAYNTVRWHLDALGVSVVPGACDGEWCKAEAVADGLRYVHDADVIVVHDADVLVSLRSIELAIAAVREELAEWAIPHRLVHRLDEETTVLTCDTGVVPVSTRQLVRWPYVGVAGGGVTVLRRETYDDCPLDARFKGWGSEDIAWGWALETLHGAPWRGDAALYHLFHPHAAPGAVRSPLLESEILRRNYRGGRTRPDRMRSLVEGARASVSPQRGGAAR